MRIAILAATTLLAVPLCAGQLSKKAERGRYLAEEVGKCHECHTPLDEKGEFDRAKWMKGRVMDVQPLTTIAGWHKTSPDITPGGRLWEKWGGAEAFVKYLMTGLTPKGRPAGPPMPAYKLRKDDAEAVVEYLKTLK